MAERRMISKKIVDTDSFTEMPMSSRLLYYELNWRADDDGFVSAPKRIIKLSGCSEDDLRVLITKNFVIPFNSGIILITDWRIHNSIQKDRYHETQYLQEKSAVTVSLNGSYIPNLDTKCIQDVSKMETEVRLGKARLGKVSKDKDKNVYGEFENVFLSDKELDKLKTKFPTSWEDKIENLSFYIESKGKNYESHYATILTWERKNGSREPVEKKEKYADENFVSNTKSTVYEPMTPEAERMLAEALKGNIAYDYTTGKT